MDHTEMPPVAYPTVKIAGVVRTLKYSFMAQYWISDQKMNPAELYAKTLKYKGPEGSPDFILPDILSATVKLFAACVAHEFIRARQPIPSPDEWAALIDAETDTNPTIAVDIYRAVRECVGKVVLAGKPPAQPEGVTAAAN